ncbi:MAG TPA: hypothetical protein VHD62_15805 [Opitutaceae bacterium]|nr:hypothetical protein [Opitutaceae bacterium]
MTPGRLLWLARRDLARGWRATYGDYVASRRILRAPLPRRAPATWPIEVHVLLGRETWRLALWMLATWENHTGYSWPVWLWEDGTLDASAIECLQFVLPAARVLRKAEATSMVDTLLANHPACRAYRPRHPLAQKIFDIPLLAGTEKFILLDSDVIFFRRPGEILEWCAGQRAGCWFNEDVREGSLLAAAEARSALGVELWPRVNSGLCLLERNFLDLELCERALNHSSLLAGHPWRVEQTLIALCASKFARGGLLPPTYEVSLAPHRRPDAIARHYVGAVRQQFFSEGVPAAREALKQ